MLPHPPSPSKPREQSYLTAPQPSEKRPGHVHPAGTEVRVVEVLGATCIVEVCGDTIEVSIWNLKTVYTGLARNGSVWHACRGGKA